MNDYIDMSALAFSGFFTFIGIGIFAAIIWMCLGKKSKSEEYRELMSDMYIVGLVKKYAKEDGIDLVAELKEYAMIRKKTRLNRLGLDEAIEEELKEKIAKVNETHIK